MSVPTQNMSCFTKSNLREPSRDCCKVSRSSREQKRCPMQQKNPATSKEILEKTSRRIFQNWFNLSLEIMCLFLPPELLWAQCGKSQFTTVLLASKRCGNGHEVDRPRQTRQSAVLWAPSMGCALGCSHRTPLHSPAKLTLYRKEILKTDVQWTKPQALWAQAVLAALICLITSTQGIPVRLLCRSTHCSKISADD